MCIRITCEPEAAMLERHRLARATIARFLRKCYFLRHSEKRAPLIPRALQGGAEQRENTHFTQ